MPDPISERNPESAPGHGRLRIYLEAGASSDLAEAALREARDYLFSIQHKDHHWCGELESNVTITSEYVFLCQMMGLPVSDEKRKGIIRFILANQKRDGSWGIADLHDGDVSTTAETLPGTADSSGSKRPMLG